MIALDTPELADFCRRNHIRRLARYEAPKDILRTFPDLEIITADYERAVERYYLCRRQGLA